MKTTILLLLTITGGAYAQTACDRLKSFSLPDTTFSTAESIAAGPYKAPAQNADGHLLLHARDLVPLAAQPIDLHAARVKRRR